MEKPIYILVADRAGAKIFNADARLETLELVSEHINSAGSRTRSEVESDRPGRTANSSGHLHAFGNEYSVEKHESAQFAKHLCEVLGKGHRDKKFNSLLIAAAPQFLGDSRQHLDTECQKALGKTLDKDLRHATNEDIRAHFQASRHAG